MVIDFGCYDEEYSSESVSVRFLSEFDENLYSLRPQCLALFIGQKKIVNNLEVFIQSAKLRNEPMDHVLLYGPTGLGKTTLAGIIANEMNSRMQMTSGSAINNNSDLVSLLATLSENDTLYIDKIHCLSRENMEMLCQAMEYHTVDISIGKGLSMNSIHFDLPNFTLIGATNQVGALPVQLRDCFGVFLKLELYSVEEIGDIIKQIGEMWGTPINESCAISIARRSRGNPRIANRLLKRIRDFAQLKTGGIISQNIVNEALTALEVDFMGLDNVDRRMLRAIIEYYNGGPVGLDTLAATINEDTVTLEDMYEPYLLQQGFLTRTPRGRCVTQRTYEHLGIQYPGQQQSFF